MEQENEEIGHLLIGGKQVLNQISKRAEPTENEKKTPTKNIEATCGFFSSPLFAVCVDSIDSNPW